MFLYYSCKFKNYVKIHYKCKILNYIERVKTNLSGRSCNSTEAVNCSLLKLDDKDIGTLGLFFSATQVLLAFLWCKNL